MNIIYPDLEKKYILITGASRGIGRSIALALAKQKAQVIFNFREENQLIESLIKEIEQYGGKAYPLQFDITDAETIKKSLHVFTQEHGPISGLVNNAGISHDSLLLRTKPSDVDQVIDTNLKGAFYVTQALSRNFLKATDVSIVHISSIVGLMGNTGQSAYAASKAGLMGFSKSIAKEYASKGLRSNVICPGFIRTEMTDSLTSEKKDLYLQSIPLGRLGSAEEVSNLVLFLLSKASSYMTGEVIKIDGGLYI